MDNEKIIHQFDPVIYPARVWIGINIPFYDVKEKFYGLDISLERAEITEKEYFPDTFSTARTYTVSDKKDGWIGTLVVLWQPKKCDVGIMAHEAVHCADFICESFGIESRGFSGGEPYAYLLQWIVRCIEKVKLNKL